LLCKIGSQDREHCLCFHLVPTIHYSVEVVGGGRATSQKLTVLAFCPYIYHTGMYLLFYNRHPLQNIEKRVFHVKVSHLKTVHLYNLVKLPLHDLMTFYVTKKMKRTAQITIYREFV
jgi:hypothetical protein